MGGTEITMIELTEEQKKDITKGEMARLTMVEICLHFAKNNILDKEEFNILHEKSIERLKEHLEAQKTK